MNSSKASIAGHTPFLNFATEPDGQEVSCTYNTTRSYLYDKCGNPTEVTEDRTTIESFVFDTTGRMSSATTQKGQAEYFYDGFLNRVKKLESLTGQVPDPTKEVCFTLDRTLPYDNLLATTGKQSQNFYWGAELISVSSKDTDFFYLHDKLGSPIRLLGESTNEALDYGVFGKLTTNPTTPQPFGFTGYEVESVTDSYFAQARYYNPSQGRFISKDFICDGLNYYLYTYGNPLAFVDKDGLAGKSEHEHMTRAGAERAGIESNYKIDLMNQANRDLDTGWGTNAIPVFGNQGLHFNRSPVGIPDSRLISAEAHRIEAVAITTTARDIHASAINNIQNSTSLSAVQKSTFTTQANSRLEADERRAWTHLGNGMHPLQDLPFHGNMDTGSNRVLGHAPQSVAHNINNDWRWASGATLLLGPGGTFLVPDLGDADSLNYIWADANRTRLAKAPDPKNNPRLLEGIALTEQYLNKYLGDIDAKGMSTDQRVAIGLVAYLLTTGVKTRC